MKQKIFLTFIQVAFIISFNLYGMEATEVSAKEIAQKISHELREKYKSISIISVLSTALFHGIDKPGKHAAIMIDELCEKHSIMPPDEILNELYKIDDLFKTIITTYIPFASKTFHAVTCQILPAAEQFQIFPEQLEGFPLIIKQYILKRAYNRLNPSTSIQLNGHTDIVFSLAIYAEAHKAMTGSADNTMRLWDLTTGNHIIFAQDICAEMLQFSRDGSRIIAIANNTTEPIVTEWDVASGQKLCLFQQKFPVYHIEYAKLTSDNIVSLILKTKINKENSYIQTLWNLTNGKPHFLGTLSTEKPTKQYPYKNGCYYYYTSSSYHPQKLSISKSGNRPFYLCEQAVDNTAEPSALQTVFSSQSYGQLTEYEKKMIQQQIKEKIKLLPSSQNNIAQTSKSKID